ncbi:MAG: helix-turn-helix transcriptional regulator, partial [Clostridiales bacterium]|nr:helix-turn-helix transcriptional regulator [Clostridiales bacterium]
MKKETLSEQTKNAILDAANRVLLIHGAEYFTLEAVAAEANVSKGGLLYHFASKNKLI